MIIMVLQRLKGLELKSMQDVGLKEKFCPTLWECALIAKTHQKKKKKKKIKDISFNKILSKFSLLI